LQITGAGGVPADATAVVVNVTVTAPTATGFLTLFPADATLPVVSNLNFIAGQTVPNLATIKLGETGPALGKINIYNSAGESHVIVDVAGYYRGHDHDDRYYSKVQTQARLAANSLTCPAGSFLNTVAADGTPTCGVGAQGPQGIQGVPGPSGPKNFTSSSTGTLPAAGTDHYRMVTAAIVIPANVTSCLVTSSLQMHAPATAPNEHVYVRNAVSRNGVNFEDGQFGQYLTNDGTGRKQPPLTRSSVLAVTPGQSVAFGVYFGLGPTTAWHGSSYHVATSYLCS
jgi:hypothetical protein